MQLTPTTGHIPAKRAENVLVLRTPAPAIVGMLEFDSCWDGAPIEITESGPSVAGRLAALASRMTIKPLMTVGSYLSPLPLPLGFVDFACRVCAPGRARSEQR